jgi:TolB-like protein
MTFPARIVNEDPLLVSRGRNDGVEVGDILQIEREGKEITDQNGVVIARLKSEVGFVKITKLQETIAFVQPISGNGFSKGDLASLQIEETSSSERAPSPQAAPVKRLAEKGSSAAQIPSVAVGIIKSGATGTKDAQQISVCTDTLISRLTQTKRFQVVDRQEVDQLLDEQLFQSLGQNTDMPSAVGTLKGVDYLCMGTWTSRPLLLKKRSGNCRAQSEASRPRWAMCPAICALWMCIPAMSWNHARYQCSRGWALTLRAPAS